MESTLTPPDRYENAFYVNRASFRASFRLRSRDVYVVVMGGKTPLMVYLSRFSDKLIRG